MSPWDVCAILTVVTVLASCARSASLAAGVAVTTALAIVSLRAARGSRRRLGRGRAGPQSRRAGRRL